MSQHTALSELISELQKGYDYLNGLDDYTEGLKVAYWAAIETAKELLEKEKTIIQEAWEDGEANERAFRSTGKKQFESGSDYFNYTFTNPK